MGEDRYFEEPEDGYFDQFGVGRGDWLGLRVARIDQRIPIIQPELDFKEIWNRYQRLFGSKIPSQSEFQTKCQKILDEIASRDEWSNITNGAYFPFIIPQSHTGFKAYVTEVLFTSFIKGVSDHGYHVTISREVQDDAYLYCKNMSLTEAAAVFETIVCQSSICGICFPTALGGYLATDARTFVAEVFNPPTVVMGFEFLATIAAFPEYFVGNLKAPNFHLAAALSPLDPEFTISVFRSMISGVQLRTSNAFPSSHFSCGISFLGI